MPLEVGMAIRNELQAWLFAKIAMQHNPEKYKLTEDQLDMLCKVWAPYAKRFGGMIPPWLWLIAVELMLTGGKLVEAIDDRKAVKRNIVAMRGTAAPGTPVETVGSKPRSQFKIYPDGRYKSDRNGTYVKVGDLTAEKVDLSDRIAVREVIFANGWDVLRKAFNLPITWAADNNYNVSEIENGE